MQFLNSFVLADVATFSWESIWNAVLPVLLSLLCIVVVMTFAGLSVVAERKVCAYIQGRWGPNRTAIPFVEAIPFVGNVLKKNGLMQLVADGLKFLLKEDPLPKHVNKFWYMLAPVMSLAPVLVASCVIPFGAYWQDGKLLPVAVANLDVSLIFALAIGSLGVFGAIMAGWSSNSKLPYIGGMRAAAQVVSYELAMGLSVLPVILMVSAKGATSPLSLFDIVQIQNQNLWLVVSQPLSALIFLVALFAETNRLPFDMAESETDLVSGFHTEYGSFKFGLFFVGEYGHIVVGSSIFIALFLGGGSLFPGAGMYPESWGLIGTLLYVATFLIKIAMMIFFFIWIRWTLPRFRNDQVMNLGWKILVPLALVNFIAYLIYTSIA